jgi:hypothetical protein
MQRYEVPMTDDQSSTEQAERGRQRVSWPMIGVRYVLPIAAVLVGVTIMVLGNENDLEGGAGIVSAGLAIYAMNWLYRASFDDRRVRAEEESARAYFSAHGRWPDEPNS